MTQPSPQPSNDDNPPHRVVAYLDLLLKIQPRDELLRFAMALAVRETGDEQAADRWFAEGIRHLDVLWLANLLWFVLGSFGGAIVAATMGLGWVECSVLAALGPLLWAWIRRNRHRHVPPIGFSLKDRLTNRSDLEEAIAELQRQFSQHAESIAGSGEGATPRREGDAHSEGTR